MRKYMLEYINVSCSYQDGTEALHNISLSVSEGEKIGIAGANGAGKSTLLKSACGLVKHSGKIFADNIELCKKNLTQIRKKVGYLFQNSDNQLFMPTVLDDMVFGPVNYGMPREQAKEKALSTLRSLNIEHIAGKYNHKLSGGEKKMAAVAAVLTMEPEILLLDEPSASLDPKNRRNLINILNSINKTQLIASHDLDMLLDTCDRVILLCEGKISADGKCADILSDRELLENNELELPLRYCGGIY